MEIYVNKLVSGAFERVSVLDTCISVIWITRYNSAGEGELYLAATEETVKLFEGETLLTRTDTDSVMLAKSVEVQTDPEDGDRLIVKLISGEGILKRRIVPAQKTYTSVKGENVLKALTTDNIINPSDSTRMISFFRNATSHGLGTTIQVQVTGKNLLEKISEIAKEQKLGFKVSWDGAWMTFDVYQGADKTDEVIFSPDFENLGATNYELDTSQHYTAAYVAGQGQGLDRVIVGTTDGTTGFERRETWVDARNTSSQTEGGSMPAEEYEEILEQQGQEVIASHAVKVKFEGQILDVTGYVYGVDYGLGDIVSVQTGYGLNTSARVSEITEVEDEGGYKLIPTLSETEVW